MFVISVSRFSNYRTCFTMPSCASCRTDPDATRLSYRLVSWHHNAVAQVAVLILQCCYTGCCSDTTSCCTGCCIVATTILCGVDAFASTRLHDKHADRSEEFGKFASSDFSLNSFIQSWNYLQLLNLKEKLLFLYHLEYYYCLLIHSIIQSLYYLIWYFRELWIDFSFEDQLIIYQITINNRILINYKFVMVRVLIDHLCLIIDLKFIF